MGKPSRLLHHMENKHVTLKDNSSDVFKREEKCKHKELKQLLKATSSSNAHPEALISQPHLMHLLNCLYLLFYPDVDTIHLRA